MQELYKFYINGAWVEPQETLRPHDVIDPSTEAVVARIALGSAADVDSAVKAARAAFPAFSQTTVAGDFDRNGRARWLGQNGTGGHWCGTPANRLGGVEELRL